MINNQITDLPINESLKITKITVGNHTYSIRDRELYDEFKKFKKLNQHVLNLKGVVTPSDGQSDIEAIVATYVELPSMDQQPKKGDIYLVPQENVDGSNSGFKEYVYVANEQGSTLDTAWELLGTVKADLDISEKADTKAVKSVFDEFKVSENFLSIKEYLKLEFDISDSSTYSLYEDAILDGSYTLENGDEFLIPRNLIRTVTVDAGNFHTERRPVIVTNEFTLNIPTTQIADTDRYKYTDDELSNDDTLVQELVTPAKQIYVYNNN